MLWGNFWGNLDRYSEVYQLFVMIVVFVSGVNGYQTLKGDIQTLKGDVQTLTGDVQTLKEDVKELTTFVDKVKPLFFWL